MKKLKILLLCLSLSLFLSSCQSSSDEGPMQPEMAKSMLKLRGYEPTEAGLFKALKNNDVLTFKAFWDLGISPDAKNEKGETALTFAIETADSKTVKALAEKANLNLKDNLGNSPLHLSLYRKKEDIFKFLLEKGADVNSTGKEKTTQNQSVLYLAVIRQDEDLIKTLLEKGADPNIADSQKAVPLTEACYSKSAKPEIVKMLLEKGANPNAQEDNGATPLSYAASNSDITKEKRGEIVKMLLEKGADKKIKDKEGKTALDYAKEYKNADVVELLK